MTLKEIETSSALFLQPDDVAEVLGASPHAIRVQAHDDQTKLGFPVSVIGTRTKIPRVPFLRFVGVDVDGGFSTNGL